MRVAAEFDTGFLSDACLQAGFVSPGACVAFTAHENPASCKARAALPSNPDHPTETGGARRGNSEVVQSSVIRGTNRMNVVRMCHLLGFLDRGGAETWLVDVWLRFRVC